MKKQVCAVVATMLAMLCVGCGDSNSDYLDGFSYIWSIALLGFENNSEFVGGYNDYFDRDRTPRIELEVGKEYRIFFWYNKYDWSGKNCPFNLENHRDGFDIELDYFPGANLNQPQPESRFRVDEYVNLSKTHTLGFDVDSDVASIKRVTARRVEEQNISDKSRRDSVKECTSIIDEWNEYSITGLREGEIDFRFIAVAKDKYFRTNDRYSVFRINFTLVFTSPNPEKIA